MPFMTMNAARIFINEHNDDSVEEIVANLEIHTNCLAEVHPHKPECLYFLDQTRDGQHIVYNSTSDSLFFETVQI